VTTLRSIDTRRGSDWSPERRAEQIAKPAEQEVALPVSCLLQPSTWDLEGTMYATIRRYTPTGGTFTKTKIEELIPRIEQGFLPIVQEVPGFHCYYVLGAGEKEILSISIFESQSGAKESSQRAAEFVRNDPLKDQLGSPEVIEGELLITKEAAVGAH
jgi:hypothetical protein